MSIFLKVVAMIQPNAEGVQAPSRIQPAIEVSEEEFVSYENTAKEMPVSFANDGVSDPVQTTVYTDIWPSRYIQTDKPARE